MLTHAVYLSSSVKFQSVFVNIRFYSSPHPCVFSVCLSRPVLLSLWRFLPSVSSSSSASSLCFMTGITLFCSQLLTLKPKKRLSERLEELCRSRLSPEQNIYLGKKDQQCCVVSLLTQFFHFECGLSALFNFTWLGCRFLSDFSIKS